MDGSHGPSPWNTSVSWSASLKWYSYGTAGQTTWDYDAEVDFGLQQIKLTREGQLAEDAQTVQLAPLLKEIEDDTMALGQAIGRGPLGQKDPTARSVRLRQAVAACRTAFAEVHSDIAWTMEHTPPGEKRTVLEQLQEPLQALLDRYPPPSGPETTDTIEDVATAADTGGTSAGG